MAPPHIVVSDSDNGYVGVQALSCFMRDHVPSNVYDIRTHRINHDPAGGTTPNARSSVEFQPYDDYDAMFNGMAGYDLKLQVHHPTRVAKLNDALAQNFAAGAFVTRKASCSTTPTKCGSTHTTPLGQLFFRSGNRLPHGAGRRFCCVRRRLQQLKRRDHRWLRIRVFLRKGHNRLVRRVVEQPGATPECRFASACPTGSGTCTLRYVRNDVASIAEADFITQPAAARNYTRYKVWGGPESLGNEATHSDWGYTPGADTWYEQRLSLTTTTLRSRLPIDQQNHAARGIPHVGAIARLLRRTRRRHLPWRRTALSK